MFRAKLASKISRKSSIHPGLNRWGKDPKLNRKTTYFPTCHTGVCSPTNKAQSSCLPKVAQSQSSQGINGGILTAVRADARALVMTNEPRSHLRATQPAAEQPLVRLEFASMEAPVLHVLAAQRGADQPSTRNSSPANLTPPSASGGNLH